MVPNRIKAFVWLVKHGRVMCNAERLRRGFTLDDKCSKCPPLVEDLNYIFRFCRDAPMIWKALLPPLTFQRHILLSFTDWLHANLNDRILCDYSNEWRSMFAVILWWLWKWRNEMVFSNANHSFDFKIAWIKAQCSEIATAFAKGPIVGP